MDSYKLFAFLLALQVTIAFQTIPAAAANSKLFREYIGAEGKQVTFSDVPINAKVDFHFILSFAIDYTTSSHPSPTNGDFNVFWDTENLTPDHVSSIKSQHPNVKVALSLGGDTVAGQYVYFNPPHHAFGVQLVPN